jgi:cell division protein ZapA (FtsZ GTPase activity inhibitor)
MSKDIIITGIKVSHQMSKARAILNNQIIPREELFQIRQKMGKLSQELKNANKANA